MFTVPTVDLPFVSEDLSAAAHITSSGVIGPGAATFAALKRFPEANPIHGGWLILSIGRLVSQTALDLQIFERYTQHAY
jgi:hypothetical protein